jgi:hypothetical protein
MANSLQDRRGMKNGHTGQSYIPKPDQHITGQQCMPTPSVFEPDNWVTRSNLLLLPYFCDHYADVA